MATFVEFLVNFMNDMGITYIFTLLLVSVLLYAIGRFILYEFRDSSGKPFIDEKRADLIAALLGISAAFIFGSILRVVNTIVYFISSVSAFIVGMFTIILVISFAYGKKPQVRNLNAITWLLTGIILLFASLSIYYAFQDYIVAVNYGGEGGESISLFASLFRPEILLLPIIFTIMGIGLYIMLREPQES